MNSTDIKGFLALAAAIALLGVSIIRYQRRRAVGSALQLFGVTCFMVVALAHVFEAFAILPALGWGRPRSIGHYIDLAAALLGSALVSAGLLVAFAHRTPRAYTRWIGR